MKKIWIDGCFDLYHYGHANAIRQAREYGDHVVIGIHSFEEISKNKSLPVLFDDERYEVIGSCRWVNEVVKNTPFVTELSMVREYGCCAVVHGNDLVTNEDGIDSYYKVKAEGKFKEVERTVGISTTEIVGRMLLREKKSLDDSEGNRCSKENSLDRLIEKFKLPKKEKTGEVIFIDGNFDLFHSGHCKALENAKKEGDYLIVGLHSDGIVRDYNRSFPILNEKERKLALMSNRYVDHIISSPYVIDEELVERYGITKIMTSYDIKDLSRYSKVRDFVIQDFYTNPFSYMSTDHIINRIITNYQAYVTRQNKRIGK